MVLLSGVKVFAVWQAETERTERFKLYSEILFRAELQNLNFITKRHSMQNEQSNGCNIVNHYLLIRRMIYYFIYFNNSFKSKEQ